MREQMHHFRTCGGQALYLGAELDSAAFHIYRKHGSKPIEAGRGYMSFFTETKQQFENKYFALGATQIIAHDWPHYLGSTALFPGDFPGIVRNTLLKLIGRIFTEGPSHTSLGAARTKSKSSKLYFSFA